MDRSPVRTDFHVLAEMIPAPALMLRPDGTPVGWNRSYLEMLGIDDRLVIERTIEETMHPDDMDATALILSETTFDIPLGPTDLRVLHHDGSWVRASWMHRLDKATGLLLVVAMDVTARHELSRQLMVEARTDALTGLANRTGLVEAIEATRENGSPYLLASLDLDRFKRINDTWGHHAGDLVLIVVAKRLKRTLPLGSVIARIGGDEFVVMIPHLLDPDPTDIGQRITDIFAQPVADGGRRIPIGGSVGLVVATPEMETEDVLRRADFSLYESKTDAGKSWVLADSEAFQRQQVQLELEDDLRAAIGTGQFRSHVQPIVRISDRSTVALEALARWYHPAHGVRAAGAFIESAENLGLITEIGRDVREHAIMYHQNADPGVALSINLSALEVAQETLIDELIATTEIFGLANERVILEVTESTLVARLTAARSSLERLQDRGFKISLDDFGAGYSSLQYLATFPLDQVKLDRSILAGRTSSKAAGLLTEAAIDFIQRLGHELIVEGVETEEDHEYLIERGVEYAQGWLYGRPRPVGVPTSTTNPTMQPNE